MTVNVTGRSQDGYQVLSMVQVKRPTDWSSLEKAHEMEVSSAALSAR